MPALEELIPETLRGWSITNVLYNARARCMLVLVSGENESRLYLRRLGGRTYEPVKPPISDGWFAQVVLASDAPSAFGLIRVRNEVNRQALVRIRLPGGSAHALPIRSKARGERLWLSSLISSDANGRRLFAIVSSTPTPEPRERGFAVRHSLASVSTRNGIVRLLDELATPWL